MCVYMIYIFPQVLAAYGFVACLNPLPGFGRVYAVYGGLYIYI